MRYDVPEASRPRVTALRCRRVPTTAKAGLLTSEAIRRVENYEDYCKRRMRARKEHDRQTFEATVTAIISDLAVPALSGFPGAVAITRAGSARQASRTGRRR